MPKGSIKDVNNLTVYTDKFLIVNQTYLLDELLAKEQQ